MAEFFSCCRYCVAPKRYPGCHDHCPEYKEGRSKLDSLNKQRRLESSSQIFKVKERKK